MAGRSLILCYSGGNNVANFSSNSNSWFWAIVQSRLNAQLPPSEANMSVTIRKAATISNSRVKVTANTRATACTVRSRKNGANGNILITIGAGLTGVFEDLVNTDTVAAGDTYCFTLTTSTGGGTLSVKYLIAVLTSSAGNAHQYVGSGDSPANFSTASATLYNSWTGDDAGSTTDSDTVTRHPIPCAGVLSNLQVGIDANARGTNSIFRSRINGADGNQTITVAGAATGSFEDAVNTDAVAEMDRCGFSLTNGTGAGAISVTRWNMMFVGTADETPYCSHGADNSIVAGTHYGAGSGDTELSGTESDVQIPMLFDCTIQRVGGQWLFGTDGGTIRLRVNNVDANNIATTTSSGEVLISDSATQDSVLAGDLINVVWTNTNNGNAHFQQFALLDAIVTPPPAADVRATQAGGYVGRLALEPLRVTQFGGYVGIRALIPGCLTNNVQCWRIERTDGTVYRFTAHDKPLTFRGEVYTPCGSLLSSALQTSAEFGATENMDLTGVIASGVISRRDLWSGRFDGADVEVWRVDWTNTVNADLLAAGRAGSVEFGTSQFTFEVTTAGERLQQRPILQPYMPTCRFKLGDARCTVDLAAVQVSGTVTAVTATDVRTGARRRIFTDSSRAEANDYFQLGRVTWVTGENAGMAADVKLYSADTFTLETPMQYDIQIGDTYTARPGCNRIFETCDTKFANSVNFGGFPHLRGTDDLQQTPGVKQ